MYNIQMRNWSTMQDRAHKPQCSLFDISYKYAFLIWETKFICQKMPRKSMIHPSHIDTQTPLLARAGERTFNHNHSMAPKSVWDPTRGVYELARTRGHSHSEVKLPKMGHPDTSTQKVRSQGMILS